MFPRITAGWLTALLLLCCAIPARADGDRTRYLPLDHPAYHYLDLLQRRGRLLGLDPALRPYTRAQLGRAVEAERRRSAPLTGFERAWLERLAREAALETAPAAGDSAALAVIVRPQLGAGYASSRREGGRERSEAGIGFGGAFSHLVFDSRFLRAPHLMRLEDSTAHRDPRTERPLEEGLIRPMEGYLKADFAFRGGAFSTEFFFGRLARNWSPMGKRSLMLDAGAGSFDHFGLTLRSRHLVLSHLAAALDGISYRPAAGAPAVRANRYLTAHRLDIRVRDHLRFGISESTVYGGAGRGFDPALLNPFTSYRLVGIQNKRDHANNTLVGFDWQLYLDRLGWRGQVMIDDLLRVGAIQDRWALDTEALLRSPLGLERATLALEATVVSSFAYNTFQPYERYLLNGRPLGAPLGNDYWRVGLSLGYAVRDDLELEARLARLDRGSRRVAYPALELVGSGGEGFPTATVERELETGLALRWLPCPWLDLAAEGGYRSQRNRLNRPGLGLRQGYGALSLRLHHDLIVTF